MTERGSQIPASSGRMDYRLKGDGSESLQRGLIALAIGCLAFCAVGLSRGSLRHFMLAYLTSVIYYLTVSLGALFFLLLHHLTGARWSIVLRRLAESLAMLFPLLLALFIPILGWLPILYPWANPRVAAADRLIREKAAWLNPPFFGARALLYFGVWIALATLFYRLSLRQDRTGAPGAGGIMRRLSAPGMLLFAVTVTFASFDWIMSLDPHWYSTIFGVYLFAGAAVAIYASLILLALALGAAGQLGRAVTIEHFHDLGKMLFAFIIFWAYIAFSQMMLIWMGNLPEETVWYARRWHPPFWQGVSWLLLAGHFVLPFLFLLPRTVKRFKPLLGLAAAWLLLLHYVDIYWLIMPNDAGPDWPLRATDLFLWIGMGCLVGFVLLAALRRQPLLPIGDPLLAESIAFENS